VNLKTAARRLGVHYQTAYRWVRSGQLVAVKVGSGYEISEAALTRFQVQRAAVERVPELPPAVEVAPVGVTRASAIATLDAMVERVSIDARPVAERATRLLADVLGDAAVLYGRDAGGEVEAVHVAHNDAACEVTTATIARHGDPAAFFATVALRCTEALLLPQVPQRNVRHRVRPEIQQHLMRTGCYSVISVPIVVDGVTVAALVASRDTPARPYTRDDLEFVTELANRVRHAMVIAVRCQEAWDLREAVVAAIHDRGADELDAALAHAAGDRDAAAILDLDLRHVVATDAYASHLGVERDALVRGALAPMARDDVVLRDALARVLFGEIDYFELPIEPVTDGSPRVMVHAGMVREADATPRCVVVVTHSLVADTT
jgi:excisionase family DNA binding protein